MKQSTLTVDGKKIEYDSHERFNVRSAEALLFKGGKETAENEKVFIEKTNWMNEDIRAELKASADAYHAAKEYVATFNGKFLCERLRDGYIGMRIAGTPKSNATYWQTCRGRPFGTIVAIDKDHVGISYVNNEIYEDPIIGLALALHRAKGDVENPYITTRAASQYAHFLERVKRFYEPEQYSRKGKTPLLNPNYDEITLVRDMVQKMNKLSQNVSKKG